MVIVGEVLNDFLRFVCNLIMEFAAGGAVNLALKKKGDMIIKNLDLKPMIDAMMRDFLKRVLSLLSPSRSNESTSLRKSLRCWFGSSDRSPWNEHPFAPTGWCRIEDASKRTWCRIDGLAGTMLFLWELDVEEYLRRPSLEDIEKTYALHEENMDSKGMLGSIYCMHWIWKNCPKALHGQFKRRDHKYPTLMLEAVADKEL
ncbi:putative ribonuclease H-like domain-containing protein [Tanacetum coccineum]